MPFAASTRPGSWDVKLYYELDGNQDGPPLLFIPGLGMQLVDWPDHLLAHLRDAYRLILVDNRDRGLSTELRGAPSDAGKVLDDLLAGREPELAYGLSDMAADAVAVLDELDVDRAHVVGVSMGGMIAQTVAIEHTNRVHSLASIMSTTGAPDVGQPTPEALEAIMSAPADDSREGAISHGIKTMRTWASPEFFNPDELAVTLGAGWDRVGGIQAEGTARQLCAIVASAPRDEALRGLDTPTTVLHGTADQLIQPSGGERTAACIPGAELLLLDGMGHDMPKECTGTIAGAITDLVARSSLVS